MAFLEVRNIRQQYGTQTAVNDVSFTAERGDFVSLLGPSGSGKTTLLRIVAGFQLPDAGQVLVGEEDVTQLPPQKRDMGMVFQSYALFPNMTAADNVAFGLRTRKRPAMETRQRVDELLAMVGLAEKAQRFPHQLSGGEQQRVALARALAPNPRVLLLDEPLSALDARIRLNLRTEIRHIQKTLGITALYVTHDQEEALAMSDRIVVFNQGRVEQIGTPQEIYDQPATPFVSTFVGTTNRLSATVRSVEDRTVAIAGQVIVLDEIPAEARTGDRVELWIRPEAIRPASPENLDETNRIRAVVDQVMFLGAHVGVKASVGADESLMLDVARYGDAATINPGDALSIMLPSAAVVTLVREG